MTDDLVGRHRAALIEAGREAGAFLVDDVSDDFLLYVPGEVKGRIAKLTARIEALEAALIQARSDFHLLMLGTVSSATFHEAKAARDRVHAALTPEAPHAD